jgi:hypothetical protein
MVRTEGNEVGRQKIAPAEQSARAFFGASGDTGLFEKPSHINSFFLALSAYFSFVLGDCFHSRPF